ncbi:MAG: tetraacyldisaccharide 4'-kinase [Gammaproteobacteria bacterium]|nr:tetraacyldisaccharide 4'-kinase [Gammaproteobacteria bacterium]
MKLIVKFWYSKNPFLFLLLPFSYFYQFCFWVHKLSYILGFKKRYSSPVPLIVVGNLTVGGTGKTPFTIALAKLLSEKGYTPGVVSRGYKGKIKKHPQIVTAQSDPAVVGDEAVLIFNKTNYPVVVAPQRAAAIKLLLANYNCDVIISDDGLQHHAINKDIEIVIVDGERKFGNGWCLPAGPLREPLRKLSKVDFIVYNDNSNVHRYSMSLLPQKVYNLVNPTLQKSLSQLPKTPFHVVAAIGHPERFFNTFRNLGYSPTLHSFADHHKFIDKDFDFCDVSEMVIMTEKDAVKCSYLKRSNFWVLPVASEISAHFLKDFLIKLRRLDSPTLKTLEK